ncbi:GtrA family protein [Clostridium bovifaecis]|uniref:GtrA family protein n=1 Tax=Clostridium bovifaecis TaxID=2184719 RepID=A0A6I6F431_9CLOT|nr:GtrA family protein [Clostridium bovifaecis]
MDINNAEKNRTLIQLITYGLIGGSNVLINLIIINILSHITGIYSGITMYIFYGISFVAYSINGYYLNRKFTFTSKSSSYFKYASVLAVSAFCNSTLCTILTFFNIFSVSEVLWLNFSVIFSSIAVGILTFIVNKYFVFKDKTK